MLAGRELDEKVAEALGWEKAEQDGWWVDSEGIGKCPIFDFKPSTTWEGMGVLVEEVRKQELLVDIEPYEKSYESRAFRWGELGYEEQART